MRFHPLFRRLTLKKAALAAVAVSVAFAFTAPKVQAQTAQSVLQQVLLKVPGVKATATINTATAAQLETAVANAILSGTTGYTPAALAEAALEPYPISQVTPAPKVRADREVSAGGVAAAAIGALITEGTDTSFSTDVGAIASDLVSVNAGNKLQDLTAAGQTVVVNDSIGKIDAAYAANTSDYSRSILLAADVAIGETASQAEVSTQLAISTTLAKAGTISITNATAAQIVAAVDSLVTSNTNPAVTPATLATSIYAPYPPLTSGSAVRADRAISAPEVVTGVISQLLLNGTSSTFTAADLATDAGAVAEDVAVVNGADIKLNLAIATREAVIKDALGALSNGYTGLLATNLTQADILAVDETIGADLASDATLGALTANGLTTILQASIPGVLGLKGTATAAAPYAAENFVSGILSIGVPNSGSGATLTTFATAILKSVGTNTGVDELVSYQVATKESDASDVSQLGEALYLKYPKAEAKITQGILASISATGVTGTDAQGSNSTGRMGVLNALAAAAPADAVAIAEGGVFDDPLHSPQYTSGVFDGIVASGVKGPKTVVTDAPALATGIGSILGSDGDVLTNVATTFCTYVTNGTLPIASVPTYAADLIAGAVKGGTPATQFSTVEYANSDNSPGATIAGGALSVNTAAVRQPGVTPAETVVDLESIEDQFADAVVTSESGLFGNAAVDKTVAAELGLLAEDVAKVTKNYTTGNSVFVAADLEGSLIQYIDSVAVNNETSATFVGEAEVDITKDIEAAGGATVKSAVAAAETAAINSESSTPAYTVYGAITIDETAVTNL